MRYLHYAEAYGWTPEQVDRLPATVEPWLGPLQQLMREASDERSGQRPSGDG